ncbi:MAG: sugar isomerase [Clostridiaceae bacterium]|nr:sugar isomerase [Clostridiaceae bacterium]
MASFLLQVTIVICGFIVPRLIILTYGSDVNGLISSITQFLGYIVLLEAGVGAVVRSSLYKPLANKDILTISRIIKSTEKFFRIIALLFVAYLIAVAILLPYIVITEFDYFFTFTLVLIIGVGNFAQYFFGLTYQLLLQADQKLNVTSLLQAITIIINTIIVVILIYLGASIIIVKLCSTALFVLRPLILNVYVNRKYCIIRNCNPDNSALKQKWDGLGHHIAYVLRYNSDIVILTLFTNIREVSVYSIYLMIVTALINISTTFSSGIQAAFGDMIAKDEFETLHRNFNIYEFLSFLVTTVLFTSGALLISPFVSLYTTGITDVNYHRPLFAYIFLVAQAAYCIRLPYNTLVIASGHFKQTRNGAFVEALINIVLSLVLVHFWGIVGVAVGTLCSMVFRTVQYAIYLSRNILNRSIWLFIKRSVVSVTSVFFAVLISNCLPSMLIDTYTKWCIFAIEITSIVAVVTILMNCLFYRDDIRGLLQIAMLILKRPEQEL